MKLKEIREREPAALEHELVDQQRRLFELRSQAVTEKLENPTQLGQARRTIARIKTVQRERALAAAKEGK